MKIADLQIGAEYAVGGPREKTNRLRDRARVVEIGEFSKDRWGCHAVRQRVRVVCLDPATGLPLERHGAPVSRVYDAQEILRPWEDEQARYDALKAAERDRKEHAKLLQERKDAAYEEVFEICQSLGLAGFKTFEWDPRPWKDFRLAGTEISEYNEHNVVMTVETFRDLLRALALNAKDIFGKNEE